MKMMTMDTEQRANILLVDDRPENLMVLEAVLDDPGYNLVRAGSGEEALKHLLEQDFALVLLDALMPGMDGFETASAIRERKETRDLPIVFVTAEYKTVQDASRGYAVNAVDYILKPFDKEILKTKVSVLVDLHRRTAQAARQAELLRESESRLESLVHERTAKLQEANKQLRKEILERERAEEELKARTSQVEAANRELEAFSYSVSHDLRAPLRAINGFAQIIARRYRRDLNEEGRHYFENIVTASHQMDRLINDILEYSRLGRKAVSSQRVALGDLLAQVTSSLADRVSEAGALLDLPDNPPVVRGDPTLLTQILANLLSNALTYRKPGAPLRITVSCEAESDHIIISTADNGIGIPAEHQKKIFDVFQRLHSEETYAGTGIGLAIVKRSVELMGGQVWVESEVNEGSTFFVKLPRER